MDCQSPAWGVSLKEVKVIFSSSVPIAFKLPAILIAEVGANIIFTPGSMDKVTPGGIEK